MTFADLTVGEFAERVAAGTTTPGGGAVAAVGGALGAALCEMACGLTVGREEYADVEAELVEVRDDLAERRERLLALADEDSAAIDDLMAAYGVEGEGRAEAIEGATLRATEVPHEVAEACLAVVEAAAVVTGRGNPNAAADAGTGALVAHAAMEASIEIVRLNLDAIGDEEYAAELADRIEEVEQAGEEALARVRANVEDAS